MLGEQKDLVSPRLSELRPAQKVSPLASEPAALARRLARGEVRAALGFAGQGAAWLGELTALCGAEPWAVGWVEAAETSLLRVAAEQEVRWSGLLDGGVAVTRWVKAGEAPPADAYLASAPVAMPMIFLTQVARFESLVRRGLGAAADAGALVAATGHSSGLAAAVLVAEAPAALSAERVAAYVELLAWLGFHAARVTRDALSLDASAPPMAAVIGPTTAVLEAAVRRVHSTHPEGASVAIALYNDRRRHVVSGAPAALEALRAGLLAHAEREAAARRAGQHGGRLTTVSWEPVPTSAAFHAPLLEDAVAATLARRAALGFDVAPRGFALPVFDPATSAPLSAEADPTAAMVRGILTRPGHFQATLLAMEEAAPHAVLLDLGPGKAIAGLSAGALRGTGVAALALADELDRERLFAEPLRRPVRYDAFAPRTARLADGRVVVDNAFSRATGAPPVLLAGMTPTTVDVPIVAAAANAGFVAELAGGGQVTEGILAERLRELEEALEPGATVVFNALLLDSYLWGLHLGQGRLVQKAMAAGRPLAGVTVSAGIPPVDEAVRLLDELASLGGRVNAFKPGTRAQVQQVVAIAQAAPQHTIFVHLEGGKAGGHHSWEDLDELLLDSYHLVRAEPNLVLCAGGGVRDEARAVALLTGAWAERHGLPRMPVDAVLIGTLAMACREASASPSVKAALVAAGGDAGWVHRGSAAGGVTSGQSQLDADIHYLDNAAARCGRLLDQVAGDAAKVAARRDEIIAALALTAKPYFGDLEAMTYAELVTRLVALLATGRGGRYEDGAWPDLTFRQRALDVLQRSERRLAGLVDGDAELVPTARSLADLDDPTAAVARFLAAHPTARSVTVHPHDATWFVREVCARPGKPVPFVPVLDADVRRWYKADSLWQAQDDRFDAEQVLVIPGPEAVAGITRADEPVAELLGRMNQALLDALAAGTPPRDADRLSPGVARSAPLPAGVRLTGSDGRFTLQVQDGDAADGWLAWAAARCRGPVAAFLAAPRVTEGTTTLDNPIRRLFVAEAGAELELEIGLHDELDRAVYRTAGGELGTVAVDGDAVVLELTPLGADGPAFTERFGHRFLGAHLVFTTTTAAAEAAVAGLYGATLFAATVAPVDLFETATDAVLVDGERARAYGRVTGLRAAGATPPLNEVFSLAWPTLYRAIACDALGGGLLRLVHLDHAVTAGPGWPLVAGETVAARAAVARVADHDDHRELSCEAGLYRGDVLVARLEAGFFIRGPVPGARTHRVRAREAVDARLVLADDAAAAFLAGHEGVSLEAGVVLGAGDSLRVVGALTESRPVRGEASFGAAATILRDGAAVGTIALDARGELGAHPLRALLEALGADRDAIRPTPRLTLATADVTAPAAMDAFAEVGGDLNPIHRSALIARLAGLEEPIVHGMWTAARLHAFVVDEVAGGDAARVDRLRARFSTPVLPGEALRLEVARVGKADGALRLEARASVMRGGALVPAATVTLRLRPARRAWVFPGQGIQQRDMGMASYARSVAAKAVWDRADAHTRRVLGLSILRVVRENPRELVVLGERLAHPQGVLHLTQLTQVAMAVLAYAQVAELEEAGVWVEDAIFCGHSVGEYNALSAAAKVLPLEAVVEIVYQRGRVMHGLVPRDAHGDSGFAMGVIRPHYAGLDDVGAEALVAEVAARTGRFLEIVNYNVRGRQYSVTGQVDALEALAAALAARTPAGKKPAYVEVPGIDVPFHSRRLRGGVEDFRAALERHLPHDIAPERLVGRYIPNLVARPFALTPAFVEAVRDAVGGPSRARLDAVLGDFEAALGDSHALARLLLIELLAWQFASPVRWITTQETMFAPVARGGLGVREVVEVGVGYQPTLSGMARYTLTLLGAEGRVRVLNVEADRAFVYAEDADAAPVAEAPAPEATVAPGPAAPVVAEARPAGPVATERPADVGLTHGEALTALLALQAKVRPEQVGPSETIDALFDGVSSRRNQVLVDMGAEFDVGSIDRAHETPVAELAAELGRRAAAWRGPGAYLQAASDEALRRVLGRAGMGAKDVATYLGETYGFGPGLTGAALTTLALEARGGASARGGDAGGLGEQAPATKEAARRLLDAVVTALGARRGVVYGRLGGGPAAAGGGVVDAAAVRALEEKLLGKGGALYQSARAMLEALGHTLEPAAAAGDDGARQVLDALTAELGADFVAIVAPVFDAKKHVAFLTAFAAAQRDVARVAFDGLNGRMDAGEARGELARLAPWAGEPRVSATARWFAGRAEAAGHGELAAALAALSAGELGGGEGGAALSLSPALEAAVPEGLRALYGGELGVAGKTALVTGASPGSIAIAVVEQLLRGGARVVVTTTTYDRERLAFYRRVYERAAAPGAELHVVPCNQASFGDVDGLIDWLSREETEQAGASVRVLKPAMTPDLLVPFAALKDFGTVDQLGGRAEGALRAMVLGTERLIGQIARRRLALGGSEPCHVLLPLSPNHGIFGGDGAYAESKAALEVLLTKWHSEQHAWGRATGLVGARIGWVRGTNLMAGNDAVAPALEAATGITTFGNDEMGRLLGGLLGARARARAAAAPMEADLTGGLGGVRDLKGLVDGIRARLEGEARVAAGVAALEAAEGALLGVEAAETQAVTALPAWPVAPAPEADLDMAWPGEVSEELARMVVVVGFGELSPGGTARTRYELEVGEGLSAPAVLELAWMTGLVRYEETARGGSWVDGESGERVAEDEIAGRYGDALRERVGVRFIEPATVGFDPARSAVMETVYLERDLTFRVGSEEEARSFLAAEPEGTVTRYDEADGAWVVTRKAGTVVRVPREVRLTRRVGGQLPTGFGLGRYGFPGEMLENVDPVALMNLAATVEAFVSAGTTPEELLGWVHPSRVATTQGAGMGGMRSLHRLYVDHLLGRERQNDILQETLINVVFAYVAATYVGSYGPMAHPVAACATAALSIEDACDKILVDKADVVMAGGWDDLSLEGVLGFGDMNATCETDKMLALGLAPDQMSRANDRRRRGFVEAQGGGALLLARGDVARDMGLPVYGVVAYAGSFGDGINRSIPAPGIGATAAALGGARSPLGRALARLGLSADDVAVVSKHDTSTQANDPNEAGLHDQLQRALGRTEGNPLMVVSQKALTGHAKGGAAAWQTIGLCQMLADGVIPPNRNLEAIDPALEAHRHLLFTNERLAPGRGYPMRAGLATSLGFGHVSAVLCVVHPAAFARALAPAERASWREQAAARQRAARSRWARVLMGREALYEKRVDRRFQAADGTEAQRAEETAMLLDPGARLSAESGRFVPGGTP